LYLQELKNNFEQKFLGAQSTLLELVVSAKS
jgi:hypothetical protein